MILNCIIGSAFGTLVSIITSFYIVRYQIKKDVEEFEKNTKKLIDEMNTFKLKICNEI